MTSNSLKKPEKSLPFHWYYDSKIFQKEIDKIFNDEWIYVCHVNSIKKIIIELLINNKNIVLIKSKSENISYFIILAYIVDLKYLKNKRENEIPL